VGGLQDGNYLKVAVDQTSSLPETDRFGESAFLALQDQNASLQERNRSLAQQVQTMTAAYTEHSVWV
jgi:hypothetical protein